jgi:hypothetical protein
MVAMLLINNISVIALNVNSIRTLGRQAFLHDFLNDKNPLFTFISETRLKSSAKVCVDNHQIVRNDKEQGAAILLQKISYIIR